MISFSSKTPPDHPPWPWASPAPAPSPPAPCACGPPHPAAPPEPLAPGVDDFGKWLGNGGFLVGFYSCLPILFGGFWDFGGQMLICDLFRGNCWILLFCLRGNWGTWPVFCRRHCKTRIWTTKFHTNWILAAKRRGDHLNSRHEHWRLGIRPPTIRFGSIKPAYIQPPTNQGLAQNSTSPTTAQIYLEDHPTYPLVN